MKIFYAVQATGNGHISRAITLMPYLQQYGQVDCFLSGNNSHLEPSLPIKYRSKGLSLYYNNAGGLNYKKILFQRNPVSVINEARGLPVEKYDLVLNDYDIITSIACTVKKVRSIHFGHQASFQYVETPLPEFRSLHGEFLLKNFVQATQHVGLHFEKYHPQIFEPVIKKEILEADPTHEGHITVYLPALHESYLKNLLSKLPEHHFEVFSKSVKQEFKFKNITLLPIDQLRFNKSLISCDGVICGAGFETPAEAMHLGKKVLAMPIWGQYEQYCNAAALKKIGIFTTDPYKPLEAAQIEYWIQNGKIIKKDYSQSINQSLTHLLEPSDSENMEFPSLPKGFAFQ
jgi:uncharacterized protein (TIGR00661 family)